MLQTGIVQPALQKATEQQTNSLNNNNNNDNE